MRALHVIRHRSLRAQLGSTGAVFCLAGGLLVGASVRAGASELCVHTKKGVPSGPLVLRDACKKRELEIGTFNGQKWTLATHTEDVAPREMGKRAQAFYAQMSGAR